MIFAGKSVASLEGESIGSQEFDLQILLENMAVPDVCFLYKSKSVNVRSQRSGFLVHHHQGHVGSILTRDCHSNVS